MESIFFLINYVASYFKEIGKKTRINLFRNEIQDIEDVQELSDAEYNRRLGKFFPKSDEDTTYNPGFYSSRIDANCNGDYLGGPTGGGSGFYF